MKDFDTSKTSSPDIDIVITWVDGNEERYIEKRNRYFNGSEEVKENDLLTGKDKTRFLDNGEIYCCLQSIHKYAPWVRKIHLITDDQVPSFLTPEMQKKLRISIVDHTTLFESYEQVLPTFNARTIETALWRIPDLAPSFIYFNDDFFLVQPVEPHDFFKEGKPVLRGRWAKMRHYGLFRMKLNNLFNYISKNILGITRSMHLLQQMRSACLAGFKKKYFLSPHVPHPIRTATLKHFFEANVDAFEKNIVYKFRNTDQFSAVFLAHHLEIKNQNALLEDDSNAIMIHGEMDFFVTIRWKLNKMKKKKVHFLCLQGAERIRKKYLDQIKGYFE
ncbi:stealth family protein [Balneolaceae bacterium ANBcel3]|nr:stealth family protein [Balneolaceae bacterium ANBcel3]